jgi:Protein of unknown function DUF262/Protein of unknown function (DUF1524)
MAGVGFHFDSRGIGKLLQQGRLQVPPNQRSYAWREKHIRNLFQDLNEAISNGDGTNEYFLGTIVLVQKSSEEPSIVDGQQRLATTTILLARIRDRFLDLNRDNSARSIEDSFLRNINRKTELEDPRIQLNLEDNEFFIKKILPARLDLSSEKPLRPSNRRLLRASKMADELMKDLVKHLPPDAQFNLLNRWVDFLEHNTTVLVVTVPDEVGAFRMFETLNDRGLRASQSDILKNYFFSKSGNRYPEAQMMWNVITAAIDSIGRREREYDEEEDIDKHDLLVTYHRHLWVTTHGPTKARELADKIKGEITNETRTLEHLQDASEGSNDYATLWSSRHAKWAVYKPTTRNHVETIAVHLQVEQIRPLLFAVARHFSVSEADKAFHLFVSWSVRFLIFGGRGGMLDTQYSNRAKEVGTKQITKASELKEAMTRYVPTDAEFEEAFATARVSRQHLARYYLRALEKTAKGIPQPEYVANEDVADIDLEHVLPLNPNEDWDIDDDSAQAAQKLLGNMVLLKTSQNREIGNQNFEAKRLVLGKSGYDLTKQVRKYEQWGLTEIRERQAKLAQLAVKTWPI